MCGVCVCEGGGGGGRRGSGGILAKEGKNMS